MKDIIRYSFLVFGFLVIGAVASVQDAAAQGPLGQILNRMEAHSRTLDTVQANVTMKKYNPQLDETDTYTGSTSYIPKTSKVGKGRLYMRLDWVKPAVEQVAIIGDDYRLYKPSINQVYVGKVNNAKTSAGAGNALGFMSMNKEQIKANYDVQIIGQENIEDGTPTMRLLLKPKTATTYKSAELWVDGNGMPVQAKVIEQNNDTTTVTLSGIRKNATLNVAIFKLNTKGAKEIKV